MMSELQRNEFVERMSALSAEEMELAIRVFPNELLTIEVGRRLNTLTKVVSSVRSIMDDNRGELYCGKE